MLFRKILIVAGSHVCQMLSSGMSFSFGILYREIRLEFNSSQSDAAWTASMFNSLIGFVVAGSHVCQMLSSGMSFSFGILYREIRLEFNSSQSDAAWTASMFNSLIGFVGFPLGVITSRVGERWVAVVGAIILALGMLTSMFATEMSTLYLTYGLIAGLGAGIIHYCGNTILGPHFDDRWRPVVMTVANAGIPLSTLVLPPVMTIFIEKFNWRKTFMMLSCLSLVGIPSGLVFFQPKVSRDEEERNKIKDPVSLRELIKTLLKNTNYLLFFLASFTTYFGLFVPATFLPDLMYESNRTSTDVYAVVMVLGSSDFVGRLLFGAVAHRIPMHLAFLHSFGFLLFGVSTAVIIFARSFVAFIILAVLLGLGSGAFNGLHVVMAAHVVHVKELRLAYGLVISIGGTAMLSGMPLAGLITDSFGTQRGAYVFSGCLFCFGALLTAVIGIREICRSTASYTIEEQDTDVKESDKTEHSQELGIEKDIFVENSTVHGNSGYELSNR